MTMVVGTSDTFLPVLHNLQFIKRLEVKTFVWSLDD